MNNNKPVAYKNIFMFSICFYDMDQNMDHEVVAEEVLDCIALSPVVVWERN